MKPDRQKYHNIFPEGLSLGGRIGITAILVSLMTLPFSYSMAVLPLLFFIVLCFTAPFLPGFSFFLPIISRGLPEKQAVAITFDDGPDPASTPALLHLLSRHQTPATFYVNGLRAKKYPDLIRKIVSLGHTIGNHSYNHDNFIMLKRTDTLKEEIEKTQQVLHHMGVFPLTFRPPVGVTNPKLDHVLKQVGIYVVNFSRRAGDMGNRKVRHLSEKILKKLRSGDIIMLHDIPPRNDDLTRCWLDEIDCLLTGIREKNLEILPLSELIDRPVMGEQNRLSEDSCQDNPN